MVESVASACVCHARRGDTAFEISKNDRFWSTPKGHGHTAPADTCGWLRTVATRLANTLSASTPKPPGWNGNPCYVVGKNILTKKNNNQEICIVSLKKIEYWIISISIFLNKDVGDFGACFLSCMIWNWKEAIKWSESLFFRRNFGMFGWCGWWF